MAVRMMPRWPPCVFPWPPLFMTWEWYDQKGFHVLRAKHGMTTIFHMIHTMIIVWSSRVSCFSFFKSFRSNFSQPVYFLHHYIGHLTCVEWSCVSQMTSYQKWTKNSAKRFQVSFFANHKVSSCWTVVSVFHICCSFSLVISNFWEKDPF